MSSGSSSVRQEQIVDVDGDGRAPAGIDDVGVLGTWIAGCIPAAVPPLQFGLIAAGGSNLTYRVDDASGQTWILRRPPRGQLVSSAHDVAREYRIMSALADSTIPVPQCLGATGDDLLGAPFCLFSYEAGWIFRDTATAIAAGPSGCATAGENMFDTLADLHLLDPATVGLDTLSKPGDYVGRQLRRWKRQYDDTARGEPMAIGLALGERLEARQPPDLPRSSGYLIHGDYHIDNVVFAEDFGVRAVLDWELSTLGHPIADLAWALIFWTEAGDEHSVGSQPVTTAPGFASRDELADRYARRCEFPMDDLGYFIAFSYWKLACLSQAAVFRSQSGSGGGLQAAGGGTTTDQHRRRVEILFELGTEAADRAGL